MHFEVPLDLDRNFAVQMGGAPGDFVWTSRGQVSLRSSPHPKIVCPNCNRPLRNWSPFCEEAVVGLEEQQVPWVGRRFFGICDEHGPRIANLPGNHASMGDRGRAAMERRYRRVRNAILARLSLDEGARFKKAMLGKILPTDEELARWDTASTGVTDGFVDDKPV